MNNFKSNYINLRELFLLSTSCELVDVTMKTKTDRASSP